MIPRTSFHIQIHYDFPSDPTDQISTYVVIALRTSSHIVDLIFDSFSSNKPPLQEFHMIPRRFMYVFESICAHWDLMYWVFQIFTHDPTHDSTDSTRFSWSRTKSSDYERHFGHEGSRWLSSRHNGKPTGNMPPCLKPDANAVNARSSEADLITEPKPIFGICSSV